MVVVKVGPSATKFKLHTSVLCEKSTFFNGILKWPCKETVDNVVNMPEDDEQLFNAFVNWLYGFHNTDHDDMSRISTSKVMGELVDLFRFGDQIGSKSLQHYVIKTLFNMLDFDFMPRDVIEKIYNMETPFAKPLRTMAVDFYLWEVDRQDFTNVEISDTFKHVTVFAGDCLVALGQIAADEENTGSKVESPWRSGSTWRYMKMIEAKGEAGRKPSKTATVRGSDPTTTGLPTPETGSDASHSQHGSVSDNPDAATRRDAEDASESSDAGQETTTSSSTSESTRSSTQASESPEGAQNAAAEGTASTTSD